MDLRSVLASVRILLAVSCAAAAQTASAEPTDPDWSQTITPQSVAPHLKGGRARIVVIAATEDLQTGRAGLVLQAALRASGQVEQVLEGDVLGSVEDLDDQAIVQRAAALPADTVAVVRLLAPAEPLPAAAVVNLYTMQGELLTSLSAPLGEPLAPLRNGAGSALGEQAPAARARPTARQLAEEEYNQKFIGFVGFGPASAGVTQTTLRSLSAYEGALQRPLTPAAFYARVGHPALGKTYEERDARARRLLIGGGVALGLGALAVGLTAAVEAGLIGSRVDVTTSSSVRDAVTAGLVISSAGTIVGLSLIGVGISRFLDRHPIPPSEALRLGDLHNRALRRRLGLLSVSGSAWR